MATCASCGVPGHHVADGVDARLGGLLILVHLDESAVQLDLGILQADLFGVGFAAHGHQQLFHFQLFLLAVPGGESELHAVAGLADVVGARAGFRAQLLLAEVALQFLGNIFVFHRHDARQHLYQGYFGAKTVEDGGELHAHRAGADDRQALGNLGEVEDLDVGEDESRVGLEAGQHARFRAGGDDDILRLHGLHARV